MCDKNLYKYNIIIRFYKNRIKLFLSLNRNGISRIFDVDNISARSCVRDIRLKSLQAGSKITPTHPIVVLYGSAQSLTFQNSAKATSETVRACDITLLMC